MLGLFCYREKQIIIIKALLTNQRLLIPPVRAEETDEMRVEETGTEALSRLSLRVPSL